MKQEPKNEMDILLRNLGQATNTVPPNPGNGSDGSSGYQHLDADELNAYAEQALPAVARARYTEHLAECERCRQIVSQLSVISGVVVEKRTSAVSAPTGIKSFLKSLFSPMVLRYAVPALALIAVASIGLMMFRRSGNEAELHTAQTPPVAASPGLVNYSTPNADALRKEVGPQSGERKPAETERSKVLADDSKHEKNAKATEPATTTDQISAPSTKAPAYDTAAADKTKGATVEDKRLRSGEVAQQKMQPSPGAAAENEAAKVTKSNEGEFATRPPKEAAATLRAAKSAPQSKMDVASSRAQSEERDAESRTGGRADKDESSTRSVAGRRFRREGSVWIDVAYDSSRATVNIARGSEQYRALVADEPEIKTIADQLAGEVIVVWKNRAYRIR
jgi:Putative zinc-finger